MKGADREGESRCDSSPHRSYVGGGRQTRMGLRLGNNDLQAITGNVGTWEQKAGQASKIKIPPPQLCQVAENLDFSASF